MLKCSEKFHVLVTILHAQTKAKTDYLHIIRVAVTFVKTSCLYFFRQPIT